MPRDNIENALKKVRQYDIRTAYACERGTSQAAGGNDKGNTHLTFEVMGPGSVGIMV